ncbi:glycoside hydrolase [Daedaleopsis nitida]|nr:glycoside hydrolase [Daedaleopsis nitida]
MLFRTSLYSAGLLAAAAFVKAAPTKVARQAAGVPKIVVAHQIVGLTAGFTVEDWTADLTLAQANGIDGFALNVGNDDFTTEQVTNAFTAAEQMNSNFQLFFSFDMNVFPCAAAGDADTIRSLTLQFAGRPNQLKVDGKAFVSTFAGQQCTFGQADAASGWRSQYTQHPDITGKIHFVPSFFIDPSTQFAAFTGVMDGDFHFNSGWPFKLTADNAGTLVPGLDINNIQGDGETALQQFIGSFDDDNIHLSGLGTVQGSAQTYMAAVAPWFFTHFGGALNKNFVFDGDEHLWVSRWENLIANRDKVSLVEIVTWNDFGESHYIGPQRKNLPAGSEAWVNGFDHQGWLDLTNFFATQFKTGQAPPSTRISSSCGRARTPRTRPPPTRSALPPASSSYFQDKMWAVVLATADGQVTLSSSDQTTQTFDVKAGMNKLQLPLTPGGFMHGTLTRNGQTVIDLKPDGYTFDPNPTAFNYNAFVTSAKAQ